MKPLPKIIGVLSILAAVFGALNTAQVISTLPPAWGGVVTALAAVTAALSHSLTGTGGKPSE